jgi:hypothetical protein
MSFLKWEYWPNGEVNYKLPSYVCDTCGARIASNGWWSEKGGEHCCVRCSFIAGDISEEEFLVASEGSFWFKMRAAVKSGKIYVWEKNKRSPFLKKPSDYRKTKEYYSWRLSVFERDKFACVYCHGSKPRIEAHHLKKFIDYPDFRFDVNNGITLCLPCHHNAHRKVRQ